MTWFDVIKQQFMQFGKSYAFDSFSQICLNLPLWFGHVWASCCHPHPLLNYSIQCSMHRQPARIGISPAFCEDRLGPAFTVNARTLSAHLIHAMPSRFSRLPGAVGVESALGSLTFFLFDLVLQLVRACLCAPVWNTNVAFNHCGRYRISCTSQLLRWCFCVRQTRVRRRSGTYWQYCCRKQRKFNVSQGFCNQLGVHSLSIILCCQWEGLNRQRCKKNPTQSSSSQQRKYLCPVVSFS